MEMDKKLRHYNDIRRVVMVVDDEPINQEMLGFILKKDYEVVLASNGEEALEKIRSRKRTLSMILLDLNMPVMDGYRLLEILREDEELKYIPVIVLTAEDGAEVRCLELGAVDFIKKPYNVPSVILARVRRAIELSEDNRIIQDAEQDELTGLYNRVFFFEYASQMDPFQEKGETDAIVINIDHFHLVNELYGRIYGDQVLQAIADGIREFMDENRGIACRCDGDMFYIYCPHQKEPAAILDVIRRHLEKLPDDSRIRLRMGVYAKAAPDELMERRFERAKLACSTVRGKYIEPVACYDVSMSETEVLSERLVNDLKRGLDEKQFKVWFQPKYAIQGEQPQLSSAEALIRWDHPEFGMISPSVFIPLFENNGLVQKLDHYVWAEAGRWIASWKSKYGFTVPVSVNISRVDMYDPRLKEKILTILEENHLTPEDYLLEITESAYSDDLEQLIHIVEELRVLGFMIEMDDFGAGYSTLNMLTVLPVDVLKLDMQFVKNATSDRKNYRLVELMKDIARFLEVPIVAEGVETKEQCEILQKIGFDLVQGYYFSPPLPPEEFEKLIKKEVDRKGAEIC